MKLKMIFFFGSLVCSDQHIVAATEMTPLIEQKQALNSMQNSLSQQQQLIIPIAAHAANGDLTQLNLALNEGLDQGLTINEIKAVLEQSYAYAGFPRSLNALSAFMQVLEKRKVNGIQDPQGKDSRALAQDFSAIQQGTENQTQLVGQPVKGALFEFSPEIDMYLKAHLFGDIFSRDVLSWQDREVATVSMLSAFDGVESQLQSHVNISKTQGITLPQFKQIQKILTEKVSAQAGQRFETALLALQN